MFVRAWLPRRAWLPLGGVGASGLRLGDASHSLVALERLRNAIGLCGQRHRLRGVEHRSTSNSRNVTMLSAKVTRRALLPAEGRSRARAAGESFTGALACAAGRAQRWDAVAAPGEHS